MNNTFFVTQMKKDKKINLNRSVVAEAKTTSHRRLNHTEIDNKDDNYIVSLFI